MCKKFYISRLYLIIEILVVLPIPYLAWNGISSNGVIDRVLSTLILFNSSINFIQYFCLRKPSIEIYDDRIVFRSLWPFCTKVVQKNNVISSSERFSMVVLNLNKCWKEVVEGETYFNRRYLGKHNAGVGLFWVKNKEEARNSVIKWANVGNHI